MFPDPESPPKGPMAFACVGFRVSLGLGFRGWGLLGGPWDLVTAYNWSYNPTYNWGNPCKPIYGDRK